MRSRVAAGIPSWHDSPPAMPAGRTSGAEGGHDGRVSDPVLGAMRAGARGERAPDALRRRPGGRGARVRGRVPGDPGRGRRGRRGAGGRAAPGDARGARPDASRHRRRDRRRGERARDRRCSDAERRALLLVRVAHRGLGPLGHDGRRAFPAQRKRVGGPARRRSVARGRAAAAPVRETDRGGPAGFVGDGPGRAAKVPFPADRKPGRLVSEASGSRLLASAPSPRRLAPTAPLRRGRGRRARPPPEQPAAVPAGDAAVELGTGASRIPPRSSGRPRRSARPAHRDEVSMPAGTAAKRRSVAQALYTPLLRPYNTGALPPPIL